jgi:NitT/TauT family transport system substrate-binding protein
VHLGYFPNITHAVALVGVARGTFKQALGSNVDLQTSIFNAGPALITALLGGSIDIGYVGPNPAINGYVQSKALSVIAGASSGGALFVVRPGLTAKALAGKTFADPQKGGTQDISLRHYLQVNGYKTSDQGGDVKILPTDNANALTLFKLGQIDGAWEPEPYASRLVLEDKGQVLVDERTLWPEQKFTTTELIVSNAFLTAHPDLVAKFLQAHVETVQYINNNLAAAKQLVNSEIKRITTKGLTAAVLNAAFSHLDITYDPLTQSLLTSADNAFALGLLGKTKPDLSGLFNLGPLNDVLSKKGLAVVVGP